MVAISVIIPVYNAEKYIKELLVSVCSQTFTDFEVILVNDGSTDSTREILEEFAFKDSRLKIVDQDNQGPSAARNKGLSLAIGNYVTFLDSDDWIEKDMFNEMYKIAKENNPDVVISAIYLDYENFKKHEVLYYELPVGVLLDKEKIKSLILTSLLKDGSNSGLWNKLYKRELLNSLSGLDETVDYGEDWKYLLEIFDKARTAIYIDHAFYHYVHRNNYSLTKKYRSDSFEKIGLWMYQIAKRYSEKWEIPTTIAANRFCLQTVGYIINEFSIINDSTKKEIRTNIRNQIDHPLLREAIDLSKGLMCSKKKKIIFLLMKYRCFGLIYVIGIFYKFKQKYLHN